MAPNIYSNEELIHQPANVKAYPINKTVSQKPICKEEQVDNEQETISSKKEGVFTPTNFNHMSREQLIARLLVLENDKSSSNSSLKVQQPPIATRCLWKDCNKNFDTLKRLISHITELHVGSGKPSYRCEWEGCPRREYPFTKRHKMQNHLRTHTGERPFICKKPDCKKRFSRLDSLTTHLKTHSNIRPFVCIESGCGKAYYHSRSLKKHEKIHQMTITASSPTKKIMLDPPAMSLPSTSNRMSQHRQPFIPYSGFMYGEKMSLVVDNSNYNPFVLNTGLTNQ
ncbi:hypothetical protein K501DRAFT_186879 [Backusella circina FSU 941]|nr:hypothetical protein K501DRAFT_186879 [Backusella circina FSU 941]